MSSREFNQDTSRAKKAADRGAVIITDRGRPAHVLLTYEAYEQLLEEHPVTDLLGSPAGIADIDLHIPDPDASLARPAWFD